MVEFLFASFIVNILIITLSFIVLNFASNIAINNAVHVSTITRLGKTAVGFSIIAFSTSLPELTVAFIAAFSGGAALSVGNVLGSNIVNITVIVGWRLFWCISNVAEEQSVLKNPLYQIVILFLPSPNLNSAAYTLGYLSHQSYLLC